MTFQLDLADSQAMTIDELAITLGWPGFWLGFALILAILEITSPTFFFLFLSAAAVGAMVAALCGLNMSLQLLIFGCGILLSLLLLRPRLLARLNSNPPLPSRSEVLKGKYGKVTQAIEPHLGSGRVQVEGEDWAASSKGAIPSGADIVVIGADGIILLVRES